MSGKPSGNHQARFESTKPTGGQMFSVCADPIAHEHRDGHRTPASGHRGNRADDLCDTICLEQTSGF